MTTSTASIYIPFNTMSDLKNTQYLDGIWIDYESNEYQKMEKMVREIAGGGAQLQAHRRARGLRLQFDEAGEHSRS